MSRVRANCNVYRSHSFRYPVSKDGVACGAVACVVVFELVLTVVLFMTFILVTGMGRGVAAQI